MLLFTHNVLEILRGSHRLSEKSAIKVQLFSETKKTFGDIFSLYSTVLTLFLCYFGNNTYINSEKGNDYMNNESVIAQMKEVMDDNNRKILVEQQMFL